MVLLLLIWVLGFSVESIGIRKLLLFSVKSTSSSVICGSGSSTGAGKTKCFNLILFSKAYASYLYPLWVPTDQCQKS